MTTDPRWMAGALEAEWADVLFLDRCIPAAEWIAAPDAIRQKLHVPSPFYAQVATIVAEALNRSGLKPRGVIEYGAALGRFARELALRCPSIERHTLVDREADKLRLAAWLLTGAAPPATVPVLDGAIRSDSAGAFGVRQVPPADLEPPPPPGPVDYQFFASDILDPLWKKSVHDLVVCLNVIDHAKDPEAMFEVLAKSVAREGLLVLASPLDWQEAWTPVGRWRPDLMSFFDQREWEVLVATDLPFYFRGRARRLIVFASELIITRRRQ